MTTCRECHGPIPPVRWHPLVYCCRRCQCIGISAALRAREAEVDEVVVIRLVSGSWVPSTKAERMEAVTQLSARGRSASWTAMVLHVDIRSVWRYRAELNRAKKGQAA